MRLIDADAVAEAVKDEITDAKQIGASSQTITGLKMGLAYINTAPTVDAVPVRHGKWEDFWEGYARCSECGEITPWMYASDYCGHCGAEMEDDNETD